MYPTNRKTDNAVFAVTDKGLTFRIGQPATWSKAQDRWDRLDRRASDKGLTVRHDGRRYKVRALEVRMVDDDGRGIGSERHAQAFPVPYRLAKVSR